MKVKWGRKSQDKSTLVQLLEGIGNLGSFSVHYVHMKNSTKQPGSPRICLCTHSDSPTTKKTLLFNKTFSRGSSSPLDLHNTFTYKYKPTLPNENKDIKKVTTINPNLDKCSSWVCTDLSLTLVWHMYFRTIYGKNCCKVWARQNVAPNRTTREAPPDYERNDSFLFVSLIFFIPRP